VFNKELSEDRQNFELLTDEKDALEKQYTKRIAFLRAKHSEKIEQVSLYHERKLESERQRTTDLKKKLDVRFQLYFSSFLSHTYIFFYCFGLF
jgi:hypothetical protein